MSPDHGRTTKMAEGSAELKTDGRFPKTITVELTMRLKVVGVMTLEVSTLLSHHSPTRTHIRTHYLCFFLFQ